MRRTMFRVLVLLLLVVLLIGVQTTIAKAPPVELKIEVFDRALPGFQADNNYWTKYCQDNFGTPNNITLKYVTVPRFNEVDRLNVLMASNDAPDLVFTYDIYTTYRYAKLGGLADLAKPLNKYGKELTKWLGPDVLDLGVFLGKQYTIPAKRALYGAINSFIRKDWLDKLGLPVPKTTQELYDTLKAFKEKDPGGLGKDQVIAYGMALERNNILWESQPLIDSFKGKMTPEQQGTMIEEAMPGVKEGIRLLNKMYNEGLISPEFPLDKDTQKLTRDCQQGRVGFVISNLDQPYRINPRIGAELKKNVPGGQFVAIDPFVNKNGQHIRRVYGKNGIYLMVPQSSKRVNEVIKYLNWLAKPEVMDVLTNGVKGVNYKEMRDGIPVNILVDGPQRLSTDMCMILNGKDYGDEEKNIKAGSFGAPGYEAEWVQAYKMSLSGVQYIKPTYPIDSEAKLKETLLDKETEMYVKCLTSKLADFDQVFDSQLQEYMDLGGNEVYKDRVAYYKEKYGKKK